MRRIAPGCQSAEAPGRRGAFDAFDRQPEVLHPRREHIAEDAPCFLDVEFRVCVLAIA